MCLSGIGTLSGPSVRGVNSGVLEEFGMTPWSLGLTLGLQYSAELNPVIKGSGPLHSEEIPAP